MIGHGVRAKKELDMENQSKLGKYLVERTIKEISIEFTHSSFSTICSYDDNITAILKSGVIFFFFF